MARGLRLDRAAFDLARAARRAATCFPFDRARRADAAARIEKAAFTRADLVEVIAAQVPVDSERSPREVVERAVEEVGVRLTAPRAAHQREGHERFTLDRILAEEAAVLDLADARDDRAQLWVKDEDITGLSAQQAHALREIARSPWLVQPLSTRGRGQDHRPSRAGLGRAPLPKACGRIGLDPARPSTSPSAEGGCQLNTMPLRTPDFRRLGLP